MVENRHFKFCHCYFCWLYNITLDRRPLWSLVCLLFVAVELCTELKLSTERRSKEFAALTVEKTQIQSSIESVQHLQLLLILWVCQRQHPTHWLRRLTQRTRLWFLPSLIWVLDMHLEGHQVTIAPHAPEKREGTSSPWHWQPSSSFCLIDVTIMKWVEQAVHTRLSLSSSSIIWH